MSMCVSNQEIEITKRVLLVVCAVLDHSGLSFLLLKNEVAVEISQILFIVFFFNFDFFKERQPLVHLVQGPRQFTIPYVFIFYTYST